MLSPGEDLGKGASLALDRSGLRALVTLPVRDTVLEVDLGRDSLLWLMASDGEWHHSLKPWLLTLTAGTESPQGLLSATWAKNGGLLLLEQSTRPRVLEILVDLTQRTLTQLQEYRSRPLYASGWVGEVAELAETQNLQITECGRPEGETYQSRILEFSRERPSKAFLELTLKGRQGTGCYVARSQRLRSLYGSKGRSF